MTSTKELMEAQWNRRGVVNGAKPVRWFDEDNPLKGGYHLKEGKDEGQRNNGSQASRVRERMFVQSPRRAGKTADQEMELREREGSGGRVHRLAPAGQRLPFSDSPELDGN